MTGSLASVLSHLVDPIVVIAFGGWSDASQAATDAVDHLISTYQADSVLAIDPGDYYDFQVSRPVVHFEDNRRILAWPTTEVLVAQRKPQDLMFIRGPEPNFHWPKFAKELSNSIVSVQPSQVLILGSMASEVPHTRPVPVSVSSSDEGMREMYGAEEPSYEGPTGMPGVISHMCSGLGIRTASIWASCSFYVANSPNPKATLALVERLEDFMGEPIALGELPARAEEWETQVTEMADDNIDIADYIHRLEVTTDTTEPNLTGDAIAAEFQRYLRKRDPRQGPDTGFTLRND